LFKAL